MTTAFQTGTAANYTDLLNIIRDFLTSDADLVAASQEWTQLQGPTGTLVAGDRIFLSGPGLAGNDAIYCGLGTLSNSGSDIYNIQHWGNGGYNAVADPYDHPLKSGVKNLALWNNSMDYWISANGRHWKIGVSVSTAQSSAYCGLGLPVGATTSQYPYPFIVHGSVRGGVRFSDTDYRSQFIAHPGYGTTELFFPDNVWRLVSNSVNGNNTSLNWGGASAACYMHPRCGVDSTPTMSSANHDQLAAAFDDNFDDSRMLRRCTIFSGSTMGPYKSPMCYLDGIYDVSGRAGLSAGDLIDEGGVMHVVLQNQARSGFNDFMAMELG